MNLPFGTVCDSEGETIYHNQRPLMLVTSELAHQYLARNDDGQGVLRGRLAQAIIKQLQPQGGRDPRTDPDYLRRWDLVWNDPLTQPYKMKEFADDWIWNHAFYNADIDTLRYIAKLVGIKKEVI